MVANAAVGSSVDTEDGPESIPEDEFSALVQEIVDDYTPRVFALVEERGDRIDGRIFAWGLQFDERATVFCPEGRLFAKTTSADSAHRLFSRIRNLRLLWPSA